MRESPGYCLHQLDQTAATCRQRQIDAGVSCVFRDIEDFRRLILSTYIERGAVRHHTACSFGSRACPGLADSGQCADPVSPSYRPEAGRNGTPAGFRYSGRAVENVVDEGTCLPSIPPCFAKSWHYPFLEIKFRLVIVVRFAFIFSCGI